jgi:MFS family permease
MSNGNGNGSLPADPRMLRRVVVGATVGTALEWYDFFIYGTAAALVFGDLFFSDAVTGAGTLIAFATFGVGFVARPFGGASTLLAEHAPKERRGFFCSFAQTGVQIGLVLGTLSFLLVGLLPDDQLNAWGWRVPFLLGFVMIAVALWVRLRVEESPVFQRVQASQKVVKLPIVDAIKSYPRSVLVGIGAHVCDTAAAYMYATFTVAYATDQLDMKRGSCSARS